MLKNFKSYQLALEFYRTCSGLKVPSHLKDQLDRASSSVVLNLAEGSGRFNTKDQGRFYKIAYASLMESFSILQISNHDQTVSKYNILSCCIFKLIKVSK